MAKIVQTMSDSWLLLPFTKDPLTKLHGTPVGEGLTAHRFHAPSACTQKLLVDGPVNVISEFFHMHKEGVRQMNTIRRDGQTFRTSSTEVWDFDAWLCSGSPRRIRLEPW